MFLGIDPGVTDGGIALITDAGEKWNVTVERCPKTPQEMAAALSQVLAAQGAFIYPEAPFDLRNGIVMAFIEETHAFTKDGVTGMFNFGRNCGHWEGILSTMGIPWERVSPQVWQKEIIPGLVSSKIKPVKDQAWDYCMERWYDLTPEMVKAAFMGPRGGKYYGLTDALCIAEYAQKFCYGTLKKKGDSNAGKAHRRRSKNHKRV
jgi:hypothetical protein